jgi:hypothetical protein
LNDYEYPTVAGHWWLRHVILVTQEAAIRRIAVQSQSWANISRDPISTIPIMRKGLTDAHPGKKRETE